MDHTKSGAEISSLANGAEHVELGDNKEANVGDDLPEILRQYSHDEFQAMEKSIVRRVDFRTLPVLVILFIMTILDRNTIVNARLGELEAELGMSDTQYQTALKVLWGAYRYHRWSSMKTAID